MLPRAARAQATMPVVGCLSSSNAGFATFLAAFREGPSEQGFVEAKNVRIEYRSVDESRYDRLPALAKELVEHHVSVIFANPIPAALAAKAAARNPRGFCRRQRSRWHRAGLKHQPARRQHYRRQLPDGSARRHKYFSASLIHATIPTRFPASAAFASHYSPSGAKRPPYWVRLTRTNRTAACANQPIARAARSLFPDPAFAA